MRFFLLFAFCVVLGGQDVYSQNLLTERIRKITSKKRSVYFYDGIFHNGNERTKTNLKAIRHSFSKKNDYERIVFDFKTTKAPKIYGHIAGEGQKIYMDLFDTKMIGEVGSFGNSKYVKEINFFPLDEESLSVELSFKDKTTADIFYLENPGRLVIDLKKK